MIQRIEFRGKRNNVVSVIIQGFEIRVLVPADEVYLVPTGHAGAKCVGTTYISSVENKRPNISKHAHSALFLRFGYNHLHRQFRRRKPTVSSHKRSFLICQAWNPGHYFVLEKVT
jgi:hypothetical protein